MLNPHPETEEVPSLSESNNDDSGWSSASQDRSSSFQEDGCISLGPFTQTAAKPQQDNTQLRPQCEDGSSMSGSESDDEAVSLSENVLANAAEAWPTCEDGSSLSGSEEENNGIVPMQQHMAAQTPQVLVDNSSDVRIGPHYQYNGPVTVKQYITVNGKGAIENGSASSEPTELVNIKDFANIGLKSQGISMPDDDGLKNSSIEPLVQKKTFFLKKRYIWIGLPAIILLIICITLITVLTRSSAYTTHDHSTNSESAKIKIYHKNTDLEVFEGAKSVQWVVNIDSEVGKLETVWYRPECNKIIQDDKSLKYNIYNINLGNGTVQAVLTVNNITLRDRGLYKLRIFNKESELWDYFTLTVQGSVPLQNERIVACYVAEWANRRTGRGRFIVDDIDPTQCTHLIFAFANVNMTTNSIYSAEPAYDLGEKGAYKMMTDFKKKYQHLKVLLAMGGWDERIKKNYSAIAESPTRRKELINSISSFLIKHNFDGLDLHWQYPAEQNGVPADKENFVFLVKELREEFDKQGKGWLLTAPIGVMPDTLERSYNIPEISKYLHYMFALCYAYHGFWDGQTGPNAPLYPTKVGDELNVESSIRNLLKMGAPPEKLVLGLPLYGRNFNLQDETQTEGFGAPTVGNGFIGTYVQEDGTWGYNEICKELKKKHSNWVRHWDPVTHTPYITQGVKFMSYDNETSLTEKVELAIEKHLAGVVVYSLDTDDFRGDCADNTGPTTYPLMRAINKALYTVSFGEKIPCDNL